MTSSRTYTWVAKHSNNRQARLRLFCFPYAGGNTLIFRAWPEYLSPSIEVCCIQLPGRGSRIQEPPPTSISALIPELAVGLAPHLTGPAAFFGHSMGAMIAFELARYLGRVGNYTLTHLFVSGRRAPQISVTEPSTYDLPEPEFIEELRRLNGTPKEVLDNPELLQLMIPILRADFAVCQTYAYRPDLPLSCPIRAFGGLEDNEISHEHLEAWEEQTTNSFSLSMIPGNHFFIHSAQAAVLQILSRDLASYVS
jgi:medium-chain acyl-[acyl-carrier-protein] hydrolase